jgi:hypothetical protein
MILKTIVALSLALSVQAKEKEFETFDGRTYNGKYYPRIDIIEWDQTMQFQMYWKGKPVEMSFDLEEKNGKKVMRVHYFIKERNEHLCRRVLAPAHFNPQFKVYKDISDKDMDNVILSMEEQPQKNGMRELPKVPYVDCDLLESERSVANDKNIAPPHVDQKRVRPDKGAIKKQGVAVPFGDL